MANKKEKKITKVLDINLSFVDSFYATADAEDQKWIENRMDYWTIENGDRYFFPPFRAEFARRYFPELLAQKEKLSPVERMKARVKKMKEG